MKRAHVHRVGWYAAALGLVAFALPGPSAGGVPGAISIQGRIVLDGELVNTGETDLVLELFDRPEGGVSLYRERNMVLVVDGLYDTRFGDNPLAGGVHDRLDEALAAAGTSAWVQVTFSGRALSPRHPLASAARAVNMRGLLVRDYAEAFPPDPTFYAGQGTDEPTVRWHMLEDRNIDADTGARVRVEAEATDEAWGEAGLCIGNPAATWTLFVDDSSEDHLPHGGIGLRHETSGDLVMTWTEDSVRVGTPERAATVTIAGDARVSGQYAFTTPRTNWIAYTAPHFEFASPDWLTQQDNPMYRHKTGALTAETPDQWTGIAPVRLPQGVRVTEMTAYYADHAPGQINLRAKFSGRAYDATSFLDLGIVEANTGGLPHGNYSATVTNISHTIDIRTNAYALIVWFETAGSTSTEPQAFLGVRLTYETSVMGVGR